MFPPLPLGVMFLGVHMEIEAFMRVYYLKDDWLTVHCGIEIKNGPLDGIRTLFACIPALSG